MEGNGTPVFLSIAEPMLDSKGADDRMLRDARSECKPMITSEGEALCATHPTGHYLIEGQHGKAPSSLLCDRMDYRKRCGTCGRRTHLRFEHGGLTWYRCRRDLTEKEKCALDLMLWKARQYRQSLAGWKAKNEKRAHEYRLELSTRAEVGQDAA